MKDILLEYASKFFEWFGNILTKYLFEPLIEAIEKITNNDE